MTERPHDSSAPDGAQRAVQGALQRRAEDDARCSALYAALLGERLPAEVLVRLWLAGEGAGGLVHGVLAGLPQPGVGMTLDRIDAERHGPDGPVRGDWPPPMRVAGTVRYVAMVALALHEHGVWRSSRPASELDPVAAAMLPLVPGSWRAPLLALRSRAQVV